MFKQISAMTAAASAMFFLFACNTQVDDQAGEVSQAETVRKCEELVCRVDPYDIHKVECHLHAIWCRNNNPDKPVGYCACYSEMGRDGTPRPLEGHYFNWYVNSKGETCLVNYGTECCWDAGKPAPNPPDVSKGDGAKCAERFCGGPRKDGGQYGDTTACFKLGTGEPHAPRADDCRTQTKDKDEAPCLACCDKQADYWNKVWIDALQTEIDKLNEQIAFDEAAGKGTTALKKKRDALVDEKKKREAKREDFRKECKDICKKVQPMPPPNTNVDGPASATPIPGIRPGGNEPSGDEPDAGDMPAN